MHVTGTALGLDCACALLDCCFCVDDTVLFVHLLHRVNVASMTLRHPHCAPVLRLPHGTSISEILGTTKIMPTPPPPGASLQFPACCILCSLYMQCTVDGPGLVNRSKHRGTITQHTAATLFTTVWPAAAKPKPRPSSVTPLPLYEKPTHLLSSSRLYLG